MIDISVIVPIYNVEHYLEKCIESIINQRFKNIEIILINDASTDGSLEIINKYSKHPGVVIVNNEVNLGLSESRNKGINIARGKYLSFIDGDDFINEDFLYLLHKLIIETDSDICVSSIIHWDYKYNKKHIVNKIEYHDSKVIDRQASIRDFLLRKNIYNYTCNKLYKRELFMENNIFFPKGKRYEDAYTTYKLLYKSNRICFSNNSIYFYVQRDNSIMNQKFSSREMDYVYAVDELKLFLEKNNIFSSLQKEYYSYYANAYCSRLKKLILSKQIKKQSKNLKYLTNGIYYNYKNILYNNYVNHRHKVLCYIGIIIANFYKTRE